MARARPAPIIKKKESYKRHWVDIPIPDDVEIEMDEWNIWFYAVRRKGGWAEIEISCGPLCPCTCGQSITIPVKKNAILQHVFVGTIFERLIINGEPRECSRILES